MPTRSISGWTFARLTTAILLATTGLAGATDGFWVGKGAQAFNQAIWGGNANWLPSGQIANGVGATAYFTNTFNNGYLSTYNVTRTIGNIWFTDPANANDFTVAISSGNNIMTLQVSSGFPTLNVTQPERTLTVQTIIAGTQGLAKIGPGTLVLTNANTYTGTTICSNGTLKIATAPYATTGVFVNAGATNSVLVTATDAQLTIPGPWTNADNSVLVIDYADILPGTNVAPLSIASLSLGANLILQINGTAFVSGQTYPLITWAGTGPTDTSAFATVITPPGVNGNLRVSGTNLYYAVTSIREPLSWNTGNGVWDKITPNWLNAALAVSTYINPSDLVVFGDASGATGNPTITLNSIFSPVSATMLSSNHNYTLTGTGGIAGTGSLTLDAANTMTLTLATTSNSYSGNTTVNGGTLKLGAANVLPVGTGKGSFTVNSGCTFDLNTFSVAVNSLNGSGVVDTIAGGSPVLSIGTNNANSTFSGVLQNTAGSLNLVKYGTGQLVLQTANTFTGTVTVNAGTLTLGDPNSLSTATGLTLAGGAGVLPNMGTGLTPTINAPITLGASGTTSFIYGDKAADATLILNGPITGAGNLAFQGECVSGNNPYIVLNAQSTYTGNTLITCDLNGNAGLNLYVQLGAENALPTNTVLTLDGLDSSGRTVALDLNSFNQTIAGLTNIVRSNRRQQILNSGSLAILTVNNKSNYTFSGQLGISGSDTFGLTKSGVGKLVLTGTNTYSDATTINSGILEIGGVGQLGAGSYVGNIAIASGAALNFTSSSSTVLGGVISGGGSLTNAGTGILSLGNANPFTGTTTVGNGATLDFNSGTLSGPVLINDGGKVSLSGAGVVPGLSFANSALMSFNVAGSGQLTVSANNGLANNGGAGSIIINLTGSPLAVGTYTLINYSGSLQGSGFSAYRLGTVPSGANYQLVNSAGAVQISVTPMLTWSGAQSSQWSINAIGGSRNWTLGGSPADYANGVNVLFDDTVGSGTTIVDISVANVTPGNAAIAAAAAVAFNNNGHGYTLQGSQGIAGAASLEMDGSGTVTILNNNSYTGRTAINNGIVQVGNGGTSGSLGSGPIVDNADLQFNRSDVLAVGGNISGTGALEQNGTGTLTLAGANAYAGATTVNAGVLNLTGTNSGSSITVNNSAVLNESAAGVIAGTGVTLTHASDGISTLSGSNTFTGAITVSAGELDLKGWSTNSLGTVYVSQGTTATLGIGGAASYNLGGNSMYVGNLGGIGTVNQTSGTVSFASGNGLLLGNTPNSGSTGIYNLSGGTLTSFSSSGRGVMIGVNPACSGIFNLSGTGNLALGLGELAVGRDDAGNVGCTVAYSQTGGSATVNYLSIGGQSGSTGTIATFNITGGTFTATNFQNLVAAASSSATITLGGSALVALPAFPVPTGPATITFDFTTGSLAPQAASAAYLRGLTAASLTTNGANFNVGSGKNITIGQSFTDATAAGRLTKSGVGTLTLTNSHTYTGNTVVSNGTLLVNGAIVSPASVLAGATLGGTGTIGGSVTVNGTISPGNAAVGALQTGNQTWNGGGAYRFELGSATNSAARDQLSILGALNLQATAGSNFIIQLVSMTNSTTPGLVPDFNGGSNYTWVVATASGGIQNFAANKFTIATTSFSNAFSGTFSVGVQGNNLVVNYAVPLVIPTILGFGPLQGGSFPLTFSAPSGQTYSVLSGTNLTQPVATWTVLANGTFGASPVTYTVTGATNAQTFYRIKSP